MNGDDNQVKPGNSAAEEEQQQNEVKVGEPEVPLPRSKSLSDCAISSWIFQRLIGFCYLAAFASMACQITALVGHNGILPLDRLIAYLHKGGANCLTLGSLAWFDSSDLFLQGMCFAGILASVLVTAGVLPPVSLGLCWLLWLSIVNVGQEFLCFQWDILLLEAGFLAIFLAPMRILDLPFAPGKSPKWFAPHVVSVWLFRWLLFRLMLESGLCKINSGDETWRSLTALNYHFHTQPLPTPLAWLADKLPLPLLTASTFITFVIELLGPFCIFVKKTRLIGSILLASLQIVIALTGNYAFFNLLSFALCLFLIDDQTWLKQLSSVRRAKASPQQSTSLRLWLPRLYEKIAAILCASIISIFSFMQLLSLTLGVPTPLIALTRSLERLYLFNSYGLFATMTTVRDEIVVEGSLDGRTWKQYEFKYKPGNMFMPPCIVAPGQPRLDWQMWFASLGDVSQSPWFAQFIVRLFQNSPEVLGLLKSNPFPDQPPAYLRAQLYTYTFSSWDELLHGGQWWRSQYKGEFLPTISARAVEQMTSGSGHL